MKLFKGIARSRTVLKTGTFIEMTKNQEVLINELQKWKGRSSP